MKCEHSVNLVVWSSLFYIRRYPDGERIVQKCSPIRNMGTRLVASPAIYRYINYFTLLLTTLRQNPANNSMSRVHGI
uniref:Uncharacterized protein n=1 Tax=Megaselia scalaris TaxID=36166 RepID=T1GNF6_MEGSC